MQLALANPKFNGTVFLPPDSVSSLVMLPNLVWGAAALHTQTSCVQHIELMQQNAACGLVTVFMHASGS